MHSSAGGAHFQGWAQHQTTEDHTPGDGSGSDWQVGRTAIALCDDYPVGGMDATRVVFFGTRLRSTLFESRWAVARLRLWRGDASRPKDRSRLSNA